jgi:hypothetical protein
MHRLVLRAAAQGAKPVAAATVQGAVGAVHSRADAPPARAHAEPEDWIDISEVRGALGSIVELQRSGSAPADDASSLSSEGAADLFLAEAEDAAAAFDPLSSVAEVVQSLLNGAQGAEIVSALNADPAFRRLVRHYDPAGRGLPAPAAPLLLGAPPPRAAGPNALEQVGAALRRALERLGAAFAAAFESFADDVCLLLRGGRVAEPASGGGGRAADGATKRGVQGALVRVALAVAVVVCTRRMVVGRA